MSTHAFASATIPAPVDQVWALLREFTFPGKLISTVASVEMEEGAGTTSVGAVRKVTWKNGAEVRHRLLEVSDVRRTLVWEVLPSLAENAAASAVAAVETKVQLLRVTDGNATYISWSSDFSSDVEGKQVVEATQDYAENLKEIKAFFSKA